MPSSRSNPIDSIPPRIHFFCVEPFRGFARVEGTATLRHHGIDFEYKMTESPGSVPKESILRHLDFTDILSMDLREAWLSASRIRFRATSPQALEGYPCVDPSVFEIEVAAKSRSSLAAFHEALQTTFRNRSSGPRPVNQMA